MVCHKYSAISHTIIPENSFDYITNPINQLFILRLGISIALLNQNKKDE